MATKADRFPKRFLCAADLKGKPVRLTIKREYSEELEDTSGKKKEKSILSFEGTDKELVLNVTNFDSVAFITGQEDAEDWPGEKIELYPTITNMRGETVECIRICALGSAPTSAPKPASKSAPKTAPAPALPSIGDDLDDEIPF
jgi:hypothetical protein